MSGFARHRRSGHVIATFTGFEADLLRNLADQLVELLRDEHAADRLVDVQWATPHLASLGVVEVPRRRYLTELLPAALELPPPEALTRAP